MLNHEEAVRVWEQENALRGVRGRIGQIDRALKGNLFTEMYAAFHGESGRGSKAPPDKRESLEREREELLRREEEYVREMERILGQAAVREEVGEILDYPIVGGVGGRLDGAL